MARRNSNAGGVFVAGGSIAGAGVGAAYDMPAFGLLIGLALGILLAVVVWLRDRAAGRSR